MTPESDIVDAALRRIEADSKHPTRKLAAEAVRAFREPQAGPTTPWINEHDTGAPLLDRDATIHASEPRHADSVVIQRRRGLLGRLLRRRG